MHPQLKLILILPWLSELWSAGITATPSAIVSRPQFYFVKR